MGNTGRNHPTVPRGGKGSQEVPVVLPHALMMPELPSSDHDARNSCYG